MKTTLQKSLCTLCALLLLLTALPLPMAFSASADETAFTASIEKKAAPDVTFAASPATTAYSTGSENVLTAQIFLTGDALALSLAVSGKGSVTLGLFAFTEDYDTSLLHDPIAESAFNVTADGSHLTLSFPASAPLPAGEYLLAAYDINGVRLLSGKGHESQRAFVNGKYQSGLTFAVSADYAGNPSPKYQKPTVPENSEEYDPAPHMSSALDFRKPETVTAANNGTNSMSLTYMEENGESFTRFRPSTDASDPYVWLALPGVPAKTAEYKFLLLKVRIDETAPTEGQIYFGTDETSIQEPASVFPRYKQTTEWQYIIMNMGNNSLWKGQLTSLRFDVFRSVKGSHYVDVAYIALFKTKDAAEAFHDNFEDYEEKNPVIPDDTPDYSTYIAADDPAPVEAGKLTANGKLAYIYKNYPRTMDFSASVDDYAAEGRFGFFAPSNAVVMDGRLYCRPFQSFAFFSKEILGDDYGVRGGSLSMDAALSYGSMTVTMRQMTPNDSIDKSGIAFTLFPDGRVTIHNAEGFTAAVETGVDLTNEHKLVFRDTCDALIIEIDGKTAVRVDCDFLTSAVSMGGNTHTVPHLPAAGYVTVRFDRARASVDNVVMTHVDLIPGATAATFPVDYATWVATDDLGRTTPTAAEAGEAQDKYVGLFYFMFHDFMSGRYANDVTRWYLEEGLDALKNRLGSMAGRNGAYWAEPYFGYYSSYDEWVYRKHAAQLAAAGVDFVFLDLSNNQFYPDSLKVLFDTWLDVRKNGGQTPQIAFMFGDMPFTFVNGLYTLKDFLTDPTYADLLFKWEGKPLILGNNDGVNKSGNRYRYWTVSATTPQSKEQFETMLNDKPAVKAFYENGIQELVASLTVRKCWAWQAESHKGYWDWLQNSPQAPGRDFDGNTEQMAVSMGTHAHTNRGRSLLNNDTSYAKDNAFGFTMQTAKYGCYFAEQFEYALAQPDVRVILITGWNEWYAGVQVTGNQSQICGGTSTPGYYMVDQMSPEFSRDGEPMRLRDGVGFGDNYYYQMVSYIRRFKGMTAPETVNGGAIDLTAEQASQWEGILPVFTDSVGDAPFRSARGWASEFLYVNGTARNDIDYAKVTQDADSIFFYVTTTRDLITVDDETWMNLYVNADNDPKTGWEGHDFVINRSRTDKTVTVEQFVDGKWQFRAVGEADYVLGAKSLTVRVDKTLLGGKSGQPLSFTFKWADHAAVNGDVMRFMELGDAAPNDRFAFAYTAGSVKDDRPVETEPETETTAEPTTEPVVTTPATQVETTPAGEKGCKSLMAVPALLISLLAAAWAMKKKQ